MVDGLKESGLVWDSEVNCEYDSFAGLAVETECNDVLVYLFENILKHESNI